MRKNLLLLLTIGLSLLANTLNAQNYKWVRGGGSTNSLANGAIKDEPIKAMCTDDNKNVYILAQVGEDNIKADTFNQTAYNKGTTITFWHILFASYDCNGKMRFAKLIESKESNFAHGLVYSNGKIYVSGTLYNTGKRIGYDATFSSTYQSAFIAKFDTSGQYDWTQFIGPEHFSTYIGTNGLYGDLATDGQGNIHYLLGMRSGVQLTSTITSQTGNYDLKYDVNGNLLSATFLQFPDTNYYVRQARIDKSTGIIYASVAKSGTGPGPNQFIVAYAANGSRIWTDTLLSSSGISTINLTQNAIYFAGGAQGMDSFKVKNSFVKNTHHPTGAFSVLGKFDLNGDVKWIYHIDGSTGGRGFLGGIVNSSNGYMAGFGHYNGKTWYGNDSIVSASGGSVFPYLIIIDTSGNLVKLEQINTSSDGNATAIVMDKAGSLYLGGRIVASITPTGIPGYTSNGGNSDFCLVKYGYDCSCNGGPTSNFTFNAPSSSTSVSFTYTGTTPADSVVWDFGDGSAKVKQNNPSHTYTAGGNFNVCATVYNQCGSHKVCKTVQVTVGVAGIEMLEGISVYPNPVTDVLHVEGVSSEEVSYRMVNTVGAVVMSGKLENNGSINTQSLTQGMYMLEISANGKRGIIRVMKR